MTILQGDINKNISLMDIFQTLNSKKQQGWLIVKKGEEEYRMYFDGSGVGLITLTLLHKDFIPEKLLHSQKISNGQYNTYLRKPPQEAQKWLLDTAPEEVERITTTICRDQICKHLMLEEGYFEFVGYEPAKEASMGTHVGELFDITSILMEAARRGDEWPQLDKVFPDHQEILMHNVKEMPEKLEKSETIKNLWKLANKRSIKKILLFSDYSEFECVKKLANLYESKLLRRMTSEELLGYVQAVVAKGDYLDALEIYEELLKRNPGAIDVWEQLLATYKKQKEQTFLFPVCKHISEVIIEEEDEGKERQTQLLKEFAVALTKDHLYPKAKVILQKLVEINPENMRLRNELIDVYARLKETSAIIKEYEKMAGYYQAQGEMSNLEGVYKKIVQLAPVRQDIATKLEEIKKQKRVKFEPYKKYIVSAAVVLVVIICWFLFNGSSSMDQKKHWEIEKKIKNQDWEAAKKLADLLPAGKRQPMRNRIRQAQIQSTQEDKRARILIRRAREKEETGKLRKALQILKKDRRLAKHADIKKNVERLERKLREYEQVMAEAKKQEKSGNRNEAISKYLKLWKDPRFKNLSDRNSIQLPLQLNIEPDKTDVTIIFSRNSRYLLNSGYRETLERGIVSEDLRRELQAKGIALGKRIMVNGGKGRWRICEGNKSYDLSDIRTSGKIRINGSTIKSTGKKYSLPCPPDFCELQVTRTGYKPRYYYNAFGEEDPPGTDKTYIPILRGELNITLPKIVREYSLGGEGNARGTLCLGGKALYLACDDGYLYVFVDLNENSPKYDGKEKICSGGFVGGPVYCDGTIYIAGENQILYAIDSKTTRVIAKKHMPAPVLWAPVASKKLEMVICATKNGLYGFPLISHLSQTWNENLLLAEVAASPPCTMNDRILTVTQNGYLHILDKSGREIWRYQIGETKKYFLAAKDGRAYIQSYKNITVIDINMKTEEWRKKTRATSFKYLKTSEKKLFCVTDKAIYAFATKEKGNLLWKYDKLGLDLNNRVNFNTFSAIGNHDIFYIGCKDEISQWLCAIVKGQLLWKFEFPMIGEDITPPILVENSVFIASKKLYTLFDN